MEKQVKRFGSIEEIAEAIAQELIELGSTPGDEPLNIALSGGKTPKQIFSILTENYGGKLAFSQLHFWWGDERCVPPADEESNYYWAYNDWLKPIGVAAPNIHRVLGENIPEVEADRYTDEMKQFIPLRNELPCFDLVFLGLGDDGHTASIFPSSMDLLTSDKWCDVVTHPTNGQKRITLTGRVINNACKVIFIVTGNNKASIVKNIISDSNKEFLASHITPVTGQLLWMLDDASASLLPDHFF